MNRFVLPGLISLLFIASPKTGSQERQQKSAQIDILHAESMEAPYSGMASDAVRLLGNVRLKHDDVIMQCDSAHRFANTNIVHAFGNVHINQGDTLHLYGDRITYYGNRRYAEVRQNVRLMDEETLLTTEYLDFNLRDEYGYYPRGGVVINGDNRLESQKGYYYTKEKLFHFSDSVNITNPDYIIRSDTLKYNTVSEVAYFLGPTTIIGDETNIYCENGWYNTQTDIAQFNENARVMNNNQVLSADSLFFDNRQGKGEAFMNITVTDTVENIVIKGNYAWFVREPEEVFVTDKALFIQMTENDTLYLHADTLRSWVQVTPLKPEYPDGHNILIGEKSNTTVTDEGNNTMVEEQEAGSVLPSGINNSAGNGDDMLSDTPDQNGAELPDTISLPETAGTSDTLFLPETAGTSDTLSLPEMNGPSDTIPTPALITGEENDTVRMMVAYYGVRIFSHDMQGKCDSLYYNMRDSIIYMFDDPVIWSDESQLSAEIMELHSRNGEMDHIIMNNSSFIVSEEQGGFYNQIKGKDITGFFRNGELYRVNVSGNAETLYYPTEDNEIIGLNKAASSRLIIFLKENKPDIIRFHGMPEATLYPLEEVTEEERLLQNFRWLDHIRPKSREDVFIKQ